MYIYCMLSCIFSCIFRFRYVYSLHAFVYISISLCILLHALVNISISLSIFIVCFRGYVDYIGFLRPYMYSLFKAYDIGHFDCLYTFVACLRGYFYYLMHNHCIRLSFHPVSLIFRFQHSSFENATINNFSANNITNISGIITVYIWYK